MSDKVVNSLLDFIELNRVIKILFKQPVVSDVYRQRVRIDGNIARLTTSVVKRG